jgi:hypothetical protein
MIFEHTSKHKTLLLIIFSLFLLSGIFYFIWSDFLNEDEGVISEIEMPSDFGNDQIEKAITEYLLAQNHFSWKIRDDSINFCAIENLEKENELFPLSVWAYCGEYIIENEELKTISGSSGPVKINYPNELSFYDLNKFSYEAPRDGAYYTEDIKRIFSKKAQEKIFGFDRKPIIKKIETMALDNIKSWELIKSAIENCDVEKVFQTHSGEVTIELKNGDELTAIEPKIDDIMKIVQLATPACGEIIMGTE